MNVTESLIQLTKLLEEMRKLLVIATREYYETKHDLAFAQQEAEEQIRNDAFVSGEKIVEARMSFLINQNRDLWDIMKRFATVEATYRATMIEFEVMKVQISALTALVEK